MTLSLYIARRFLAGFALMLFTIGAIVFLLDMLELLRRASPRVEAPVLLAMELAALKLPHALQKIVPFAVLFGAISAFWRLTRSSELIVVRASGISVWQFLLPAVVAAALVGGIFITVVNPLGASMLQRYEKLDVALSKGESAMLAVSEGGLWLRQADGNGQSVIHAVHLVSPDMRLRNVTVYLYDTGGKFVRRLDAAYAQLEPGQWRFSDVVATAPNEPSRKVGEYALPTQWTAAKIQDSFSSPETLSFWSLPGFIRLLDQAGFAATRHRVYWYSLLTVPVMLGAMVLIAASFSMRMARRGGAATLIGAGVVFSFFIFFLSDLVLALGLSATIPAVLAAATPAAVTTLIGLSILLHLEDG